MFPNSISWTADQLRRETTNSAFTLPWAERLSLESESFNDEHRALLQKLNGLLLAVGSGNLLRIKMACTILSAEAQSHFTSEEAQMREADCSELASHSAQHEELRRGLASLRYSVTSGAGFLSRTALLSSLERWFVPHLTFADKRVAQFLALQAARSRFATIEKGAGSEVSPRIKPAPRRRSKPRPPAVAGRECTAEGQSSFSISPASRSRT